MENYSAIVQKYSINEEREIDELERWLTSALDYNGCRLPCTRAVAKYLYNVGVRRLYSEDIEKLCPVTVCRNE